MQPSTSQTKQSSSPVSTPGKSASKPEELFGFETLVDVLKAVDFCKENGGEVGKGLARMMRRWEDAGTLFPTGCLEDACYRLRPVEGDVVSGRPTGPVWVVNYTGYDKPDARKHAQTKLEGV